MSEDKSAIKISSLKLEISKRVIFDDFSLDIKSGEKVLLNSDSGSGKSSLVKILMGFLRPDSFDIKIGGLDLDHLNIRKIRSMISYVSQDVDLKNERIEELIEEIFSYKVNSSSRFDLKNLNAKLERLGLKPDILKKSIREISGGERQRIGFLISWCLNRPIWILDEITSGLDERTKSVILEIVKEQESTIIVISHDKVWTSLDGIRIVRW